MNESYGFTTNGGVSTNGHGLVDESGTPMIIDDPERHIFRVHRATMTSPEIYKLEQERIFDKVWLYLGHETEVRKPGDFKLRTIAGRPLIFCRDSGGQVRAFVNSCPHRGSMVCREPEGNKKVFQCMYHAWSFSNDGRLLRVPGDDAYTGAWNKEELGLPPVPKLHSYKGFVFISYNPEVRSLESFLGPQKRYLDKVADLSETGLEIVPGSQQYAARANWKLLVENTFDAYHVAPLHTTYISYLKDLGTDVSGGIKGRAYNLGHGHATMVSTAPWGRPIARWEPSWGEERKRDIEAKRAQLIEKYGPEQGYLMAEMDLNMVVFPNLIINDIMGIVIRLINPTGPDTIDITQWMLSPIGEPPEDRALALKSFLTFLGPGGLATPDDVEATEACQRGFAGAVKEVPWNDMSRGYEVEMKGAYDQIRADHELQLRAFWRGWRDWLEGTHDPNRPRVKVSVAEAR